MDHHVLFLVTVNQARDFLVVVVQEDLVDFLDLKVHLEIDP